MGALMKTARVYLDDHSISRNLSDQVKLFIRHQIATKQQSDTEGEEWFLRCLPPPMKNSLIQESRDPYLLKSIIMHCIQQNHTRCYDWLCCDVIQEVHRYPGSVIFGPNEVCKFVVVTSRGIVTYQRSPEGPRRLLGGRFVCEAAIWCGWRTKGSFETAIDSSSTVFEIPVVDINAMVLWYPTLLIWGTIHAQAFAFALNDRPRDDLFTSTDCIGNNLANARSKSVVASFQYL